MNRTEIKNNYSYAKLFLTRAKGFSLVEMLVVMAVLSVVSMLILTTFTRTLRGGNKAQIIESIKQNGQSVLEVMDKTIRNAERVVCASAPPGATLVVVRNGGYTKFRFVEPTSSANGHIRQENFNLPASPPPGSDNLYIKTFETTLCMPPHSPDAQVITDTHPQSGVSVYNGLFTNVKSAGFKDQVVVEFDVRAGFQAPSVVTGQLDPASFQTTIQLR